MAVCKPNALRKRLLQALIVPEHETIPSNSFITKNYCVFLSVNELVSGVD